MRIAILTTDTLHHAYFVREFVKSYPESIVFEETRALTAPFVTAHPFEQDRDAHEKATWFGGRHAAISNFAEIRSFGSMNSPEAVAALRDIRADALVVVGTGKLDRQVIDKVPPGAALNLHGGDPEQYRGLDTHLWAVYHGDFAGLVTALHVVAPELDTGDIVATSEVSLSRGMTIPQLRGANTETALQLALTAFERLDRNGVLETRPQKNKGRYYSFMPTQLKEICLRKFNRYCEKL